MSPLTALLPMILLLMILAIAAWNISEICKSNARKANDELRYRIMHSNIETIIQNRPVTLRSYNEILNYLITLGQLRHKNKSKTTELSITFFSKYQDIVKEIVKQDPASFINEYREAN